MRRPDFLLVGAMKAGSTTLYEDLRGSSSVFLAEKEVGPLLSPSIRTPAGVAAYEALFRTARADQVAGDVSADYAKLPQSGGLAQTALEVLGPEHRIVYSLRNPVDRAVSHHHHSLARAEITEPDIDLAVRAVPELIGYSSYATQARPFLDAVGRERVHLVAFEDYMGDRVAGFASLAGFLGLPDVRTTTDPGSSYNVSSRGTVALGRTRRALSSGFYRRVVRPLIPESSRVALRNRLLPAVPPRPAPPSADTVELILDAVGPELEELRTWGFVIPVSWDRAATHERYAALRR